MKQSEMKNEIESVMTKVKYCWYKTIFFISDSFYKDC